MKTFEQLLLESSGDTDVRQKIIEFFTNTKDIVDEKVHALADKLGIEHSDLETQIYSILVDFFQYGSFAKLGIKKEDLESKEFEKEFEMGKVVEMEHTNSKLIAEKICRDHLSEDLAYYTHLKEMEDKYKK